MARLGGAPHETDNFLRGLSALQFPAAAASHGLNTRREHGFCLCMHAAENCTFLSDTDIV